MAYDALSTEEKRELERKEKEQREKDYIDRNFFYPYFLEKNHPKKYKKIYGKNGDKTDNGILVSSVNCSLNTAYEEMPYSRNRRADLHDHAGHAGWNNASDLCSGIPCR